MTTKSMMDDDVIYIVNDIDSVEQLRRAAEGYRYDQEFTSADLSS